MPTIDQLRTAENEARDRALEAVDAIESAEGTEELDALQAAAEQARSDYEAATERRERQERLQEARTSFPAPVAPPQSEQAEPTPEVRLRVEHEPMTYRADVRHSYFGDLLKRFRDRDEAASARLARHAAEIRVERRDLVTDDGDGSGEDFVPPLYLADLWAETLREGRPFANAIGSLPLPSATGMSITLPKFTSGTSVTAQASGEGTAISDTDAVTETITTPINTVAGMQDISIQLLERSDPGMDMVIFRDLRGAYDAITDTYLLSGSGSGDQHTGITTLSSTNSVTYTDASPTAAELNPKIYDAIQQIATGRYRPATHLVMHPRRSAWIASQLSSTFPLIQQGGFNQAVGSQNIGSTMTYAGLPVVSDANMQSTLGAGTNQDEIFAVHAPDLIFYEGPIRTDIFNSPGSNTLVVRLRLFAYQAFVVGRYPTGISVISGTGLAAPSF